MDCRLPVLAYDDVPDAPAQTEQDAGPISAPAVSTAHQQQQQQQQQCGVVAVPAAAKQAAAPAKRPAPPPVSKKPAAAGRGDGRSRAAAAAAAARQHEPPDASAMQQLNKERRRKAFIGMLKLLEHGASDASQLERLVAPMSDGELLQVAEERALAGKCGNPLCPQPFSWQGARPKYRASGSVIAKVEGDSFCSKACSSFVHALAAQLVAPLQRVTPGGLQAFLSAASHKPRQGTAAQGGGVETMRAVVEERDAVQLIHEAEQAGRMLAAAAAEAAGDSRAAAAVEGYTPKRAPKAPQQQQQQQQRDTAAAGSNAGEPLEVLQLQPVLPAPPGGLANGSAQQRKPASATAAAAAAPVAAAVAPAASADELDLQAFREHRDRQLQHVQDQGHAIVNMGAHASGSDSSRQAAGCGSSQQQLKRHVRFAPDVTFSCPAQPPPPPEQPVLTFTVHDQGQGAAPRNGATGCSDSCDGSTAGLVGELHVSSAADLDPDAAAAAAADGGGSSGSNTSAAQQAGSARQGVQVMQPWQLWFPPALGGVGVPVKQSAKTRAPPRKQALATGSNSSSSSSGGGGGGGGGGGNGSGAAEPAAQAQPQQVQQAQQQGVQQLQQQASGAPAARPRLAAARTQQPSSSPRPAASSSTASRAAASSGEAAAPTGGAAAPRTRKFSPLVRPRSRSVVVLEDVPGVVVKQRGVRPSAAANGGGGDAAPSAAAADDAAMQQQQQQPPPLQQQQTAVLPSPLRPPARPAASSGNGASAAYTRGVPVRHVTAVSSSDSDSYTSSSDDGSDDDTWLDDEDAAAAAVASSGRRRNGRRCSDSDDSSGSHHSRSGGSSDSEDGSSERGVRERDVSRALDALLPFLDTSGVTVHLSEFGLLWNVLHAWVTPATVALVNEPRASSNAGGDAGTQTAAAAAAGEQPQQADDSAELPAPSQAAVQQRAALAAALAAALPPLVQALAITVPLSELGAQVNALVRSFAMRGPLPALQPRHWQLLAALLLAAAGAWRLPALRPVFWDSRSRPMQQQPMQQQPMQQDGGPALQQLLEQLGSDLERFSALLDLFEVVT